MSTLRLTPLLALLGACDVVQDAEEQQMVANLEKAVFAAERMAVEDSALRTDCAEKPVTWRAPVESLTQDIRVQRCDMVYYYLGVYAILQDHIPRFRPGLDFIGTENLTTGEKLYAR